MKFECSLMAKSQNIETNWLCCGQFDRVVFTVGTTPKQRRYNALCRRLEVIENCISIVSTALISVVSCCIYLICMERQAKKKKHYLVRQFQMQVIIREHIYRMGKRY